MEIVYSNMLLMQPNYSRFAETDEQESLENFLETALIITVTILGLTVASQILITVLFICKSKKFKEITYLPKLILLMSSAAGFNQFTFWTSSYFAISDEVQGLFAPISRILEMICFGLTFRFVRLQV